MTPADALDMLTVAARNGTWHNGCPQAHNILSAAVAVAVNHAAATAPPPAGTQPLFRGPSDVAEQDQRRAAARQKAREQRDRDTARLRDIADV